jgi:hypothetical protein
MPRQVMIWLVLALVLAGCEDQPRPAPRLTPPTSAPPTSAPLPVSTPREGKGSRLADDANGDGYADLVVEFRSRGETHLAVVYGSSKGLDPSKRTVVPPDSFASWFDRRSRADLDGDGFGDLLVNGSVPGRDKQQRPNIFWGGPRGLDARTPPTPIQVPVTDQLDSHRAIAGDFNGDGAADLAMSRAHSDMNGADLAILHGPFSRAAVAARHSIQPSPTGEEFWTMTVDKIEGRRPTGLLVYEGSDGEQTSGWLLTAGPDGLSKQGRRLNAGLAAAFGDFDGDGTRDVAAGDDGSRNNEPGSETEPPLVHKTLTVYYGDGRQVVFHGTAGPAVSGDFDGDGHDDLAFGGVAPPWDLTSYIPARIFWGGPDGLRIGENIDGVGRAAPLAAGDYDGDGDDELALAHGDDDLKIVVTDGKKALASFDTQSLGS